MPLLGPKGEKYEINFALFIIHLHKYMYIQMYVYKFIHSLFIFACRHLTVTARLGGAYHKCHRRKVTT